MDASTFDHLTRKLYRAASRRAALGALFASAGGALGLAPWLPVAAQGCIANGDECHMDAACCSGRCKRKRHGKKVCGRADNQGECTVERNLCSGTGGLCGTDSFGGPCSCYVTTTGRSFCGSGATIQPGNCDCISNKECEQRLGKGAKCVAVGPGPTSACDLCGTNGTACLAPCENLDPVP